MKPSFGNMPGKGIVESAQEVAGGVKDLAVNPAYTAGHAIVNASIAVVKGTAEAVFEGALLGSIAQTVEGGKEILMGPGEVILGVRDGVWRALIMDGVVNNVFTGSTFNPLKWPGILGKLGKNLLWNMPKKVGGGILKGAKRLLLNAPQHLLWGIPASLLRGASGKVEAVLDGAAILIGGGSEKGLSGVLVETRQALRRISKALVPKTTIIPVGGDSAPAKAETAHAPEPSAVGLQPAYV